MGHPHDIDSRVSLCDLGPLRARVPLSRKRAREERRWTLASAAMLAILPLPTSVPPLGMSSRWYVWPDDRRERAPLDKRGVRSASARVRGSKKKKRKHFWASSSSSSRETPNGLNFLKLARVESRWGVSPTTFSRAVSPGFDRQNYRFVLCIKGRFKSDKGLLTVQTALAHGPRQYRTLSIAFARHRLTHSRNTKRRIIHRCQLAEAAELGEGVVHLPPTDGSDVRFVSKTKELRYVSSPRKVDFGQFQRDSSNWPRRLSSTHSTVQSPDTTLTHSHTPHVEL